MTLLTVETEPLAPGARVLAPTGCATPHSHVRETSLEGGRIAAVLPEPELSLSAALIEAEGGPLTLTYRVGGPGAPYPEAAFAPRMNRFTAAADQLAEAARAAAAEAGGGRAAIEAMVREAEARFAYAHPEVRFNEGHEAVPYLACGTTPGSCVDINTYLVASLRAAGIEAAYFYGYFFPEAKGGRTEDGHCWVVTRAGGEVLEWDIAHHIKAGLGPTQPGLNPRPGRRVAVTHSMGHAYADPDLPPLIKLLGEPMALDGRGLQGLEITARLRPFAMG